MVVLNKIRKVNTPDQEGIDVVLLYMVLMSVFHSIFWVKEKV